MTKHRLNEAHQTPRTGLTAAARNPRPVPRIAAHHLHAEARRTRLCKPAGRAEVFCCSARRALEKPKDRGVHQSSVRRGTIVPLRHVGVSESRSPRTAARREAGRVGFFGAMRERAAEGSLLFDEARRRIRACMDILLQLLDAARITLRRARRWTSAASISWLTNIGSAELMSLQHSSEATLERHVLTRAQQTLRPEIFARVNEKLVFHRLSYEHQLEIAEKFLAREIEFLGARPQARTRQDAFCRSSCEKGFTRSSARARCAMRWKNSWAMPSAECLLAGASACGAAGGGRHARLPRRIL
jgi:hypothetical protein